MDFCSHHVSTRTTNLATPPPPKNNANSQNNCKELYLFCVINTRFRDILVVRFLKPITNNQFWPQVAPILIDAARQGLKSGGLTKGTRDKAIPTGVFWLDVFIR